jgi:3-dehydroquinate synthase
VSAAQITLIGFMGCGKSSVGKLLAERLGRVFVDLDQRIEADAGRRVREIFANEGESGFRRREERALRAAVAASEPSVIATGGGACLNAANAELMRTAGRVFYLIADAALLAERLSGATARPLLDHAPGESLQLHISRLLRARHSGYAATGIAIHTEDRSPEEVAAVIEAQMGREPYRVQQGDRTYEVQVEVAAGLETLGRRIRRAWEQGGGCLREPCPLPHSSRVLVVADKRPWTRCGEVVESSLRAAGLQPVVQLLRGGERAKTRSTLARVQDFLLDNGVERRTPVVAFGGGVIGDLVGFAAATVLRGVPVVQVPTTLLAQVDASIGGKVAINHRHGKNLLGAFHPPALVVADQAVLRSLAQREMRCGFGEIVKMALLGAPDLLALLEQTRLPLEDRLLRRAILTAIGLKAEVVRIDPEERDLRRTLNFGHTVAHALERAHGYSRWAHGEAVAVGMLAALRIGVRMGVTPSGLDARVERCLAALGLPVAAPRVDPLALEAGVLHDKKKRDGRISWVLLRGVGDPVITADLPADILREVLVSLTAPQGAVWKGRA